MWFNCCKRRYFNPRTSCEVRRSYLATPRISSEAFQSTHLLRGATESWRANRGEFTYFNPRTSCEVRPQAGCSQCGNQYFNPRTSCEVRPRSSSANTAHKYFNPRTSCEVRQHPRGRPADFRHFNPRTSCEVRQPAKLSLIAIILFQSTHLLRGATEDGRCIDGFCDISIHAPLARCDQSI